MKESVLVREVGPRDGLQLVKTNLSTEVKIEWIQAQAAAGFSAIEVTSFVPPKLIPQFADAASVISNANKIKNLNSSAVVLNTKGAINSMNAGAKSINFVVSASEDHSQSNVRCTPQKSMEMFREAIDFQKESHPSTRIMGVIATSFGCSLQGYVPETHVRDIAVQFAEIGAKEISLADTVGYANPNQVKSLFNRIRSEIGNIPLGAHFHDTRGMGLANVVAALEAGVRIFDASLGGLGGCPFAPGASGNIATEDTVYMLSSMGLETRVDIDKLLKVREKLRNWLPSEKLGGTLYKSGPAKTFQFVA